MSHAEAIDLAELRDADEASQASQWIYAEWAQFESPATWEENQADIARSLDPAVQIPKFFAYRLDDALAGIASVVPHDLPTHPELGPWLANVLVLPEWRRRGIGRALVHHVMGYASTLAPTIYLYTFEQVDLYRQLGWEIMQQDQYVGRPITIMRYPAAPAA